MASSTFQEELNSLRNLPLVDYRRQMALKRQVLEKLCQCLFAGKTERLESLYRFAKENPLAEDYARFRATVEKRHASWRSWPERLREGILRESDYNEENRRYHLYAQWLAHQQVQTLTEKVREKGLQLSLDLPLGVHPDGFDAWREPSLLVQGASAGAPPDAVFTRGQDWLFPPMHPEMIREHGYRYHIAYLRHHLRHAGILRIDHIMGFHRLFWIPKGMEPSQGVYLRYNPEELYAILALESQRSKTIVVGEDLGTVPPEVRPAMARHGLHRMYVLHYEIASSPRRVRIPLSLNSVASLNTHDMPPFAAFWQDLGIEERLKMGILDEAETRREKKSARAIREVLVTFLRDKDWLKEPAVDALTILRACLAFLSASRARVVLVNLEDLWLETQSQNIPGTKREYPNWRRKAHYDFEAFCQMPQVTDTLRMVNHLRKQDI